MAIYYYYEIWLGDEPVDVIRATSLAEAQELAQRLYGQDVHVQLL